jgi:hypothetical protein
MRFSAGPESPGLKPSIYIPKRSRGFKNPLPRTKSPGLARLRRFVDPNTAKLSSVGQIATPKYLETPDTGEAGEDVIIVVPAMFQGAAHGRRRVVPT